MQPVRKGRLNRLIGLLVAASGILSAGTADASYTTVVAATPTQLVLDVGGAGCLDCRQPHHSSRVLLIVDLLTGTAQPMDIPREHLSPLQPSGSVIGFLSYDAVANQARFHELVGTRLVPSLPIPLAHAPAQFTYAEAGEGSFFLFVKGFESGRSVVTAFERGPDGWSSLGSVDMDLFAPRPIPGTEDVLMGPWRFGRRALPRRVVPRSIADDVAHFFPVDGGDLLLNTVAGEWLVLDRTGSVRPASPAGSNWSVRTMQGSPAVVRVEEFTRALSEWKEGEWRDILSIDFAIDPGALHFVRAGGRYLAVAGAVEDGTVEITPVNGAPIPARIRLRSTKQ